MCKVKVVVLQMATKTPGYDNSSPNIYVPASIKLLYTNFKLFNYAHDLMNTVINRNKVLLKAMTGLQSTF